MAQFCEAVSNALRCINREQHKLKAKQEEALRHLYQGKDIFAWIPTGFGKSICYQLLPFMYDYKRGCSSSSPRRSDALILHSTAWVLLHRTEPSTMWNRWNLNYTESINTNGMTPLNGVTACHGNLSSFFCNSASVYTGLLFSTLTVQW